MGLDPLPPSCPRPLTTAPVYPPSLSGAVSFFNGEGSEPRATNADAGRQGNNRNTGDTLLLDPRVTSPIPCPCEAQRPPQQAGGRYCCALRMDIKQAEEGQVTCPGLKHDEAQASWPLDGSSSQERRGEAPEEGVKAQSPPFPSSDKATFLSTSGLLHACTHARTHTHTRTCKAKERQLRFLWKEKG